MKKAIKWGLITLSVGTFLYLAISFFVVSWLSYFSSSKRAELTSQEKIFFKKLKTKYGFEEISRTPETEKKRFHPKDTIAYELYMSYIDCNKTKNDYQNTADSIVKQMNQNIDLDKKFYKYIITLYCDSGTNPSYKYSYLRNDVK